MRYHRGLTRNWEIAAAVCLPAATTVIDREGLWSETILVLDEPTAALDAATEHGVMANLAEWGQGRAIFLITHRISTIRQADNTVSRTRKILENSRNSDES